MILTHIHRRGEGMSYIYILIIGVVLFIIGLWVFLPTIEGLADTSTTMLVAIRDSGDGKADQDTSIAKVGLSSNPTWNVLGKSKFVSGAFSDLVSINSNGTMWLGTGALSATSAVSTSDIYTWARIGTVTNAIQVCYDYPTMLYIDTNNIMNYADYVSSNPGAATFSQITSGKKFSWVSAHLGAVYAIGTDGIVWYASNFRLPNWKNVSSSLSGIFIRVSFDGDEAVIVDNGGKTYYTRNATDEQPSWIQLDGLSKHVSIKNRFLYRIDPTNNLYFATSPQSSSISWTKISDKTLHVECIFQRTKNMVTQRGMKPFVCKSGTWAYANKCLNNCPPTHRPDPPSGKCVGIPVSRASRPVTNISPPTYTCPTGTNIVFGNAVCRHVITGEIGSSPPLLEVFAVSGKYTKPEADAKCKSYGAILATEAQLQDSYNKGAGWCLDAWLSDESKYGFPKKDGTCGTKGSNLFVFRGVSTYTRVGATCYGIRPPKESPDVIPFNGRVTNANGVAALIGLWTGIEPCPPLYTLYYQNTTCKSPCPVGSTLENTKCVFPVTNKESIIPMDINFRCPPGYDIPQYVSCPPGKKCDMFQLCHESCPPGYKRNNDVCEATNNKSLGSKPKTQIPATISSFSYSCKTIPIFGTSPFEFSIPRGNKGPIDVLSGSICYESCPANYTDIGNRCVFTWDLSRTHGFDKMTNPAREIPNYSCPAGYTLSEKTCTNTICDMNYTETPDGMCAPSITTRKSFPATYTPRCATGYTEYDGLCYKDCDTGYKSLELKKCQMIATDVTVRDIIITPSTLKLCNDDEELQGITCVKRCDLATSIEETATCTPISEIPNVIDEFEVCNKGEILKGALCISCPEGTFPDGQICVGDPKVVGPPSTIKCTSSSFGSVKKWLCQTQEDADALLKDPSAITSYVSPKDQICVADDPTTLMYFCQSVEDAQNDSGYGDDVRDNYYSTCDQLRQNYTKLSSSMTSLKNIMDGLTEGTAKLSDVHSNLTTTYKKLNCDTTPKDENKLICQQLQNATGAIGSNSTDIEKTLSAIVGDIQKAFNVQESVLKNKMAFNCK